MTMVEINRIWLNVDTDNNKITLFGRPCVSIHVDEYIWSFIEENIVKPHKLMRSEKHGYLLRIAFRRFDPIRHRYYPLSSYNGSLREGIFPEALMEECVHDVEQAVYYHYKELNRAITKHLV